MNKTGFIQIYYGDGKGKATVAIGTAVRAAGRGYRVLVAKLLETDDSGEVTELSHIPGTTVLPCGRSFGFSWNMTQIRRKTAALYYDHCLLNTWNMTPGTDGEEPYNILVLDEAIDAYNPEFADGAGLVKALKEEPAALEVILTGHYPSEALQDQVGCITGTVMRRHSYGHEVGAKGGIKYQKMNIREYVLTF